MQHVNQVPDSRTLIITPVNWIGSPPTALTAILFNIYQIRKCRAYCFFAAGVPEQVRDEQTKKNAYYVLSCLAQFELPPDDGQRQDMVRVLTYGLRKPLAPSLGNPRDRDRATRTQEAALRARELLAALAFQLRMMRCVTSELLVPSFDCLGSNIAPKRLPAGPK